MGQISTLLGGAGVTTVIAGQSQGEEFLLIGDVDTANPLQALQVEIDGTPFITINNALLLTAFMKWMMETINTTAVVGLLIKVATGLIKRNTTYRLTNAGATTPAIFAYSTNRSGVPYLSSSKQINPSAYEDFDKFSALFITAPANIQSAEVLFADGHRSTLAGVELDSLFAFENQTEANGQLGGVTVIDNRDQSIQQVRIYCVTVALTVLVAKLPNDAFKQLKQLAA